MALKVERWQTRDGQLFPTEEEADEHERVKQLDLDLTGLVYDNLGHERCCDIDVGGFIRELLRQYNVSKK